MRRPVAALLALAALCAFPAVAAASAADRTLVRALNDGMRRAGTHSGALVFDITAGRALYSRAAGTARLPASVEKLFTTSAALSRFGPNGFLLTRVLGRGRLRSGTFHGTLYLRGGGDPTFGSAAFAHAAYGTGATMQHLVSNLRRAGVRRLAGSIVADETWFDSVRGTPATGYAPSLDVEGELSALSFNRGWANRRGTRYVTHPALTAGFDLAAAMRDAGIRVARRVSITAGATPSGARELAAAGSPRIATLVALTNAPSDNFFAEMLAKNLGARFGGGGTTARGAAVIRAAMADGFDIHPRLDDGSGLSRYDRTTPGQVVSLLRRQADDHVFTASLAVAGESGTLIDEMRGTYAQGRCRAKTGTLHDVSNVAGYCLARDGHTLAYAFLMNGIYPYYAHPIQNRMQVAVAKYGG